MREPVTPPGTPPDQAVELAVRDLGAMPYRDAFDLQKQCQAAVIAARLAGTDGARSMHLLLVEHEPPVITVSRRQGARRHLVASDAELRAAGVEVAETDRGGDITYHGPGQLVVYPILDLNTLGLRLHGYMRFLESTVIDVLAGFGVAGHRVTDATGVWVGGGGDARGDPPRLAGSPGLAKICAMGVRISRWVTMHGLALNVTTRLEHFDLIVPCGLAGASVTSLKRELGDQCPPMADVKRAVVDAFRAATARLARARTPS